LRHRNRHDSETADARLTARDEPVVRDAAHAIIVLADRRAPTDALRRAERSSAARLAEAVALTEAIGLDVRASLIAPLRRPVPATLFGAGKVEEIAALAAVNAAGLVVVDHPLTPVQQRNLERAWSAKVLDRTGIILEIFGDRARTREGRLQVELAHLTYQKSRLVRSWTHLERQRGGYGFLGGPGETQIEADRRQIQSRIRQIESELERVRTRRGVHRAERKRSGRPLAALVGYTNAGKSTLFNRLTGADTLAKDVVFATLDPTLRRVRLPHGEEIVLSDTVGFISELPTMLVSAFRATLEEVTEADLVIHVRDIASPESAQQAEDVFRVLGQLGIGPGGEHKIIEVWNKADRLDPAHLELLRSKAAAADVPSALVSAITGEGISALLALIEEALLGGRPSMTVELSGDQYGAVPWLYENAEILERRDDPDTGILRMTLRIPSGRLADFRRWAQEAGVSVASGERKTPPQPGC
jgi:GTP-binding protein HflX